MLDMKLKLASFLAGLFLAAVAGPACAQTATLPIGQSPTATTPLSGSEHIPLTQSGAPREARISNITDLVDKLSAVYSVTNYLTDAQKADIAIGSPTLDLKSAIQNIENNIMPARGGTLYFSSGVWRTDSSVLLSSNRRIQCAPGAVFKPIYNFTIFANDKYANVNLATDYTEPTDVNQTERNFEVSGCKFDWTTLTDQPSPSPVWSYDNTAKGVFFLHAKNVYIHDNEYVASDPPKFNGSVYYGFASAAACVGSSNCRFEGNVGTGMHDVFDCWAGGKNCVYKNNWFELSDNETAHRGNGYCAGMNGRGTAADFHATLESIEISGNYCYSKGWRSCFQFDPLSAGSHVNKVKITDNICVAKPGTTNNTGIYGRGQIEDVLIEGNTVDGFNSLPISVTDNFTGNGPFTCTDCITTTNGQTTAVVAIPQYTAARVVVGNYISFSSASAVGGIIFLGKYFPVISVIPGGSVAVQTDGTALATQTAGGSVSTQIWWGSPKRVRIVDNSLLNSSYAGSALIYAQGENIQIGDNSARGGTYGAITYASSFLRGAALATAPMVWGTSGAPGYGVAGSSGDNIDNYPTSRNP
ncbi:hypothetical protein C5688_04480 [Methylocystis sp. MitZ-2018]|nr:hypothetical protein C5688_04480 [Methylocystis sp. MitZ-2018]